MKRMMMWCLWCGGLWWSPAIYASDGEAFLSLAAKLDGGLGWSFGDQVVTARASFSVAEWGQLISFPRLGYEASVLGQRPTIDLGIDLKTLCEKLGAKWQLDKSLLLSGYVAADLASGKPLLESLKYGIALSVVSIVLGR